MAPTAVAATATGCTVGDERLAELSGLVADGPRWWAIADGGRVARAVALDPAGCATTDERSAPFDPADLEDIGIGPDGALQLADIGDNSVDRESVAVIVLPPSGPARVHRLAYPDGPHDAEALVVGDDGIPLVITKTTGAAGVYRPAGPLADGAEPTPLRRVGEIVLPVSTTSGGPVGPAGSRTVTGAGLSPAAAPQRAVAVRTYTDAWLFRLPPAGAADADALVAALSGGAPVQVPLPDEAQGEAVALTDDGTLVSGSEAAFGRPATVRTLSGAAMATFAADAPATVQPAVPPSVSSTPTALPAIVAAAAVGVVLVGLAVAMTVHGRRRR